ncbi:Yos1-like [Dillenia turbinata]|uniref:Yos1-like n=1 Tax=Dillenia turbinata TaxID=194707 RepID=A0AAN8V8N8_9MAGN
MGLWTLLEGFLLLANAFAILNEDRFLAPRGNGPSICPVELAYHSNSCDAATGSLELFEAYFKDVVLVNLEILVFPPRLRIRLLLANAIIDRKAPIPVHSSCASRLNTRQVECSVLIESDMALVGKVENPLPCPFWPWLSADLTVLPIACTSLLMVLRYIQVFCIAFEESYLLLS